MGWDPFEEFRELQRRLNRLFDEIWPTSFHRGLPAPAERGEIMPSESRRPAIDVIDTEKEIQIIAELPGMNKEDISIHATPNGIEISAESREEAKAEEEGYIRRERRYQRFLRRIPLPTTIDDTKVSANYKNGILELHLPKREEAKGKRIKIE